MRTYLAIVIFFVAAFGPDALADVWGQSGTLTADGPSEYDYFGTAVAATDGWLFISSTNGVYVYETTNGAPTLREVVPIAFAYLNQHHLRVSGDRLYVGDPGGVGRVLEYQLQAGSWNHLTATIVPDEPPGSPVDVYGFGRAIAASPDYLVIGAPSTRVGNREGAGAAYIYERVGDDWVRVARLLDDAPGETEYFGSTLSINLDAIAVGCFDSDDIPLAGSVTIFRRGGAAWMPEVELVSSDPASREHFGAYGVAFSGDALLVTCPNDIYGGLVDCGSVRVFEFIAGHWEETQILIASDATDGTQLGNCISSSAERVLVGGGEGSYPETASAYVFMNTGAGWVEESRLQFVPAPSQGWQMRVGIAPNHAIVTDVHYSEGNRLWAGIAYVFESYSDCDSNQVPDWQEIADGTAQDCNDNQIIDSCEIAEGADDCDQNGIPDSCDLENDGADCNGNGRLDTCDISAGTTADVNQNGIPDECECIGDLTGDQVVGLDDLARLLSNFGTPSGAEFPDGDVDDDGDVDLSDLSTLLAQFGTICP
ncbi:MAG: hypothetical protein AMXMBFR47_36920 [Planctomycetota bacterium]